MRRAVKGGHLLRAAWLVLAALGMDCARAQVVNRGMAGSVDATAYFSPANVVAGQQSQFSVVVTNGTPDIPPPRTIKVDGVEITFLRNLPRSEMTLSGRQVLNEYTYAVTPWKAGVYTIPSLSLRVNGELLTTPECKLRVREFEELGLDPDAVARGSFALMYVEREECYVGEVVPLEVTLYMDQDLRVRDWGYPDMERDTFITKRFERRYPTDVFLLGRRFYALAHSTFVSPLAAGDLELGPVTFTCKISEARTLPQGPVQTLGPARDLYVEGPRVPMRVLPLPEEGRPEGFAGAVGSYAITCRATPTRVAVGDPIELEIEVRGRGNLDALEGPRLEGDGDGLWKVFQETSEIRKREAASLEGVAVFRRVISPTRVTEEIPSLILSYFDPEERAYRTVTTAPIALEVLPDLEGEAMIQSFASSTGALMPREQLEDILALLPGPLEGPATLRPWSEGSVFRALEALAILSWAGLAAFGLFRLFGPRLLELRQVREGPAYRELLRDLRRPGLSEKEFYNGYYRACEAWRREQGQAALPPAVREQLRQIAERREELNYAGAAGRPAMEDGRRMALLRSLAALRRI
ncbi:MAG TPA: BatD family protein [Verrucomicrobiales bacterium]|nr:BatD family protein [Verrucomicrobiales bacterium]